MPFADPDRRRAYARSYYRAPEQRKKMAGACRAYRARQREALFDAIGRVCVYCDQPLPTRALTVDHKLPRSRGGNGDRANLVPACGPCNKKKGARSFDDFYTLMHPDRLPAWVDEDEPLTEPARPTLSLVRRKKA